jgi:hypothetical protein
MPHGLGFIESKVSTKPSMKLAVGNTNTMEIFPDLLEILWFRKADNFLINPKTNLSSLQCTTIFDGFRDQTLYPNTL